MPDLKKPFSPNFTPFPVLSTERLLLRKLVPEDVHAVFFLRSDERVMKYIDKEPVKTLDEAMAFIEKIDGLIQNNEAINWAIVHKESQQAIGYIGFWNFQPQHYRSEIGYVLHPDFWNQSIIPEAMKAALGYGFNEMDLHSVEANVNPENIGSIKVLEKLRFVREAYFRENYYYNGKFLDSAIYSLINPKKRHDIG